MTAHWGVPDPAAVEGSDDAKRQAFFEAFNQLQNRHLAVRQPAARQARSAEAAEARCSDIGNGMSES